MQDILDISVYGFAYINGFENGKLKVKYLLALYCVVAKMARMFRRARERLPYNRPATSSRSQFRRRIGRREHGVASIQIAQSRTTVNYILPLLTCAMLSNFVQGGSPTPKTTKQATTEFSRKIFFTNCILPIKKVRYFLSN